MQNRGMIWDKVVITMSLTCSIHCLSFLFYLFLPGIVFEETEWFHSVLVIMILPASWLAVVNGYRVHKLLIPAVTNQLGLVLLIIAIFIDTKNQEYWGEVELTLVGSTLSIIGHWLNMRYRKRCLGLSHL